MGAQHHVALHHRHAAARALARPKAGRRGFAPQAEALGRSEGPGASALHAGIGQKRRIPRPGQHAVSLRLAAGGLGPLPQGEAGQIKQPQLRGRFAAQQQIAHPLGRFWMAENGEIGIDGAAQGGIHGGSRLMQRGAAGQGVQASFLCSE